jgi:hypothetical protein
MTPSQSNTSILCAVAPDPEERVRRILTGHDLHFVRDIQAAEEALEKDSIRLVLVGARFDESRMFDLLDYIRQNAERRKIPIVAAIIGVTAMSKQTVAGLAHTTKIFGASVFVNLNDFADDETENTRLRLIINALLVLPSVVPVIAKKLGLLPGGE